MLGFLTGLEMLRPREIQLAIEASGIKLPRRQIYNILASIKQKTTKINTEFSSSDFHTLCEKNIISKDKENFVLAYTLSPIRAIIANKKTLQAFAKTTNCHIDATYRLNLYGFFVFVFLF